MTSTSSGLGGGPACTFPEDRACAGECVDVRVDDQNCGYCGASCPDGERCVLASCESARDCSETTTTYAGDDFRTNGGTRLEDGWEIREADTLSVEHAFQAGPVVVHLTARGLVGEERPRIMLAIGEDLLGPLLLRTTGYASYSLEYESRGGNETVSIFTATTPYDDTAGAAIFDLRIQECTSLHGLCDGGGYYLPEIRACAPPLCDEPLDCTRDFAGPDFRGDCVDGVCRYPSCTEPAENGLSLYDEFLSPSGGSVTFSCIPYGKLLFPRNNPRTTSVEGTPDEFECPRIDQLTWEIERFAGEGSCVEVPICGPNAPADFEESLGLGAAEDSCCYVVSWMCGV